MRRSGISPVPRRGSAPNHGGPGTGVAGALVLVGLLLAGCNLFSLDQVSGVEFQNRTDVTVEVVVRYETGEESSLLTQLKPGTVVTVDRFSTDCSLVGAYIARNAAGQEIARREGRICRPDQWVIEASPSPAP